MKEYQDNYAKVREEWQGRVKEWDLKERFEALGLSGYHDDRIVMKYFGRDYEIDPESGAITDCEMPGREITFNTAMSIYHLFYYSKKEPKASGVWIPFRDVPRAGVFTKAFFNQTVDPFARFFDGKPDALLKAGEQLGFQRMKSSDAGFEAKIYDCLSIQYLFWDGDDEFPAKANVLFDANITDFVHEETVVIIAADGLQRLMEAAEVQHCG